MTTAEESTPIPTVAAATVAGYSGHPKEGQGPATAPPGYTNPTGKACISFLGVVEPPRVYKGDGVTIIPPP